MPLMSLVEYGFGGENRNPSPGSVGDDGEGSEEGTGAPYDATWTALKAVKVYAANLETMLREARTELAVAKDAAAESGYLEMQQRRLCAEARASQRTSAEMLALETKRIADLESMRVSDARELHALECARVALQEESWSLRDTMAASVPPTYKEEDSSAATENEVDGNAGT